MISPSETEAPHRQQGRVFHRPAEMVGSRLIRNSHSLPTLYCKGQMCEQNHEICTGFDLGSNVVRSSVQLWTVTSLEPEFGISIGRTRSRRTAYLAVNKLQEFKRFPLHLVINGSHDCLDCAFDILNSWSQRSRAVLCHGIECQQICRRLDHDRVNRTKIFQIRLLRNFCKQTVRDWQTEGTLRLYHQRGLSRFHR